MSLCFAVPCRNRHGISALAYLCYGFAYPTQRFESSLSRRRGWVYSASLKFPYESYTLLAPSITIIPCTTQFRVVLLFAVPCRNRHGIKMLCVFILWVRICRAERVKLACKRQASKYSPPLKFPYFSDTPRECPFVLLSRAAIGTE